MGKGERLRRQREPAELPGVPAKRGFQLKVERALYHLKELEGSVDEWLERDAYTLREKPQAESGKKILSIEPLESVPSHFQLLIGDFVHNLRSAVDLLAFDLAWTGSRGPMRRLVAENSEFPVFWKRAPRESELRQRIGAIDPAAQTIIKSLQPHNRPMGYATDELWMLDQLWNFDKHRGLPLTLLAVVSYGIGRPGESFLIESLEMIGGGPVSRETDLLRYSIQGNVDVKRIPKVGIAFGQGTPTPGVAVLPLLTSIKDYVVGKVISPLEDFI